MQFPLPDPAHRQAPHLPACQGTLHNGMEYRIRFGYLLRDVLRRQGLLSLSATMTTEILHSCLKLFMGCCLSENWGSESPPRDIS